MIGRGTLQRVAIASALATAATAAVIVSWRTDGPAAQGWSQLLDVDLGTPSVAPNIRTRAAAAALTGLTWTEWCTFDGPTGNVACDGGTTLTKGAGSFHFQSMWPGFDGTDMVSGFKAVEFRGGDATPEAFSASAWDFDQSQVIVMQLRLARAPASSRGIWGRRAGSASAGVWALVASTGAPVMELRDGAGVTTVVNPPGFLTELDSLASGAPQWVAFKVNLTARTAQIFAQRTSGSVASLSAAGSYSNAQPFLVGGLPIYLSCEGLQLMTMGVLRGAQAEAFALADLNELDNWARPPAAISSYVRYSVVAPEVGTDALGIRVQPLAGSASTTSLVHFAHAYMPAFTAHPWKLGALSERGSGNSSTGALTVAKRNRLLRTDDLSNASWTKVNATAAAYAGESPSGLHDASSLTCSAADCTSYQAWTGQASEPFTESCYVRRNGGSDVTGRLILYRTDVPGEVSSSTFTAGATWSRVSHFAASAPSTALRFVIEVDSNGASIFVYGCQAEHGSLTAYQPQRAALVDRGGTTWSIDNLTRRVLNPIAGRVEVTVAAPAAHTYTAGSFLFAGGTDVSFANRIFIQRGADTSTYHEEARVTDSAGTIRAQLVGHPETDWTKRLTYTLAWDSRRRLPSGVYAETSDGGAWIRATAIAPSAPWTMTTTAVDAIFPGARHSGDSNCECAIERLRIWGPR